MEANCTVIGRCIQAKMAYKMKGIVEPTIASHKVIVNSIDLKILSIP